MSNILIVDDQIDFIAYLAEVLTNKGHQIAGVSISGEAAIENARLLRPDLILMDVSMPGKVDGIEAAKIIRDEMNIPIIFITAHSDRELIDRAKQTHPAAYIIKPFREIDLEISIELALCNSAAEAASAKVSASVRIDEETDFQAIEKQMNRVIQAEAIRALSAAIAHQYNNTIMAITGYAQLIELKYPGHQDLMVCTKAIQQYSKRISMIIGQLSSLTLQEEKSFQPSSVRKMLEKALSIIRHTAQDGIIWKTEMDASDCIVLADSASLGLAIYSLLKHLIRSDDGRKRMIHVICRSLILHELSTDTSENIQRGHYVYLKIQDEGFRLKNETLEWSPNSFSIPSFSARNMILFAAYHIIQNHGGNLSLNYDEDKGIMIQVYFPAIPTTNQS